MSNYWGQPPNPLLRYAPEHPLNNSFYPAQHHSIFDCKNKHTLYASTQLMFIPSGILDINIDDHDFAQPGVFFNASGIILMF